MKPNSRYKVLFEAPSVSQTDVEKAQNFDGLLGLANGVTSKPKGFTSKRTWSVGIIILLLIMTVYWLGFHNQQQLKQEDRTQEVLRNQEMKTAVVSSNKKELIELQELPKDVLIEKGKTAETKQPIVNKKPLITVKSQQAKKKHEKVKLLKIEKEPVVVKPDSIAKSGFIKSTYERAQPIEGFPKLYQYFSDSLHYPEALRNSAINGTVKVRFTINEKGKPEKINIVQSLNELMDKEAIRVVKQMLLWKPAKRDGKVVKSTLTIPLTFQVQKK